MAAVLAAAVADLGRYGGRRCVAAAPAVSLRHQFPSPWSGSSQSAASSPRIGRSCSAAVGGQPSVEFVTTAERAGSLATELLAASRTSEAEDRLVADEAADAVGLDCEGVRLGRFGRLTVMQLAADRGQRLFLLDALRPGVVEAVRDLLESKKVVKVMHDCREDASALLHQHGVTLSAVFDTQAAYSEIERKSGRELFQVSTAQLLKAKLGVVDIPEVAQVKMQMQKDAMMWARRPLTAAMARYALHGVAHLLPLRLTLLREAQLQRAGRRAKIGDGQQLLEDMAHASEQALSYRDLNTQFATPEAMAKIGTALWALVAAHNVRGLYFKLNGGRVGLASTPSALARFKDTEIGDLVLCCVSGVSMDGSYIYLDRYDHDWDYFDHQLRPSGEPEVGVFGREHRFKSSLFADGQSEHVDPLLTRGLPAADATLAGSDGLDPWEADYEDMGQSADIDLYKLRASARPTRR
eukprot:TRINITY_DN48599_c0_g1_i1.p1 TRINITY_DN48599_c0_g1~~TRINITY_DN48599_c0_g1_i1.p1  ORF type:complete len:485 (-),score=95.20 TRINITY_DN48599_c0_g1_i1:507-1907(-)